MRAALILLALIFALPATAQSVVTSRAPDAVQVSIYRDPDRDDGSVDLDWLEGYGLITETRQIAIPAGESTIRFEGVAEGMVAVSAVVTGLPGGVVQKNRDTALLSPASLLDGTLGNRVHLRRTNATTGVVREYDAVIRSGADGAVVLQTAEGFEALRCTGLPETLVYNGVPAGLSDKPVLSVTTRSAAAVTATVTLTYLATGFDWAANYVASVAPDGRTLDLFAWLTVANSNGQSFADARMMAIAGRPNIETDFDDLVDDADAPELNLSCFLTDSGRGGGGSYGFGAPPPPMVLAPPPPPPAPMMAREAMADNIVVTAQKVAEQEDLGDLKPYRVPMAVTVAANAQKQVALLIKDKVPFQRIHRFESSAGDEGEAESQLVLRMVNKADRGLGLPLPSGEVAVMEDVAGNAMLAGTGDMRDRAVGETVDLVIGASAQVNIASEEVSDGRYRVTVTNANPFAVTAEIQLPVDDDKRLDRVLRRLPRKDGAPTWTAPVPANGTAVLEYRLKPSR